jgi:hypothetical protein
VIFIGSNAAEATISLKCRKIAQGSLEAEFEIIQGWWAQDPNARRAIPEPIAFLKAPNCIATRHVRSTRAQELPRNAEIEVIPHFVSLNQALDSLHAAGYMFPQIRHENIIMAHGPDVRLMFALDSAELPIKSRIIPRESGRTKVADIYLAPSYSKLSTPRDNIENLVYVLIDLLFVDLPWSGTARYIAGRGDHNGDEGMRYAIMCVESSIAEEKEKFVSRNSFFAAHRIPDEFRQVLEDLAKEERKAQEDEIL